MTGVYSSVTLLQKKIFSQRAWVCLIIFVGEVAENQTGCLTLLNTMGKGTDKNWMRHPLGTMTFSGRFHFIIHNSEMNSLTLQDSRRVFALSRESGLGNGCFNLASVASIHGL